MAAPEDGCGPELPAALALCSCCSVGARPEGPAASNVDAGGLLGPGPASTSSADPRQLTGSVDRSNSFCSCIRRLPASQLSGAAAAALLLPAGAESPRATSGVLAVAGWGAAACRGAGLRP